MKTVPRGSSIRIGTLVVAGALLVSAVAGRADARDELCDSREKNCRTPLIELINAEQVAIDVSIWSMDDYGYVQALTAKFMSGVQIRILTDARAANAAAINALAAAGIPVRQRTASTAEEWNTMIFSGQNTVYFGSASFSAAAFVPVQPYRNYADETIYFTDDSAVVQSWMSKFDDAWVDTANSADVANAPDGNLRRRYPTGLTMVSPDVNVPPGPDYASRAVKRYGQERSKIDVMAYRITDERHTVAVIDAAARGVPVRLLSDPLEYRNPDHLWDAWNIDRLYAAGVALRMTAHQGANHGQLVLLYEQSDLGNAPMGIFGASNWSSSNSRDEHDYFVSTKPALFDRLVQYFENRWNSTSETKAFTPLPPDAPTSPVPVDAASGVPTRGVVLAWFGGPWAHVYDLYFGTTWPPPLAASNLALGPSETRDQRQTYTVPAMLEPGRTYYWSVVSKTMAGVTKSPDRVWSFTTRGVMTGTAAATTAAAATATTASTPFGGTPASVPGKIEAENYDVGGEGVAYHDTTPGNSTGLYRSDDVDVQIAADSGGGYKIKTAVAGEWLNYSVNVASAGTYSVSMRVSASGTGGTFHIEANGIDVTGPMRVPNTGSWDTFTTVTRTGVTLGAGPQILRLALDSNGAAGLTGNFNWINITPSTPPPPSGTSSPFTGTPVALPGTIQAENYDLGGEGIAYHDTTPGNSTGLYRHDNVDLQTALDTGGGYKIKSAVAGEWLNYSVDVTGAGVYIISVRVSSNGTGGTFHIEANGIDVTGPMSAPDTGSWDTFTTVMKSGVRLAPGRQIMRLVMDSNGSSGLTGNFNWIDVSRDPCPGCWDY